MKFERRAAIVATRISLGVCFSLVVLLILLFSPSSENPSSATTKLTFRPLDTPEAEKEFGHPQKAPKDETARKFQLENLHTFLEESKQYPIVIGGIGDSGTRGIRKALMDCTLFICVCLDMFYYLDMYCHLKLRLLPNEILMDVILCDERFYSVHGCMPSYIVQYNKIFCDLMWCHDLF
jgi:hypothetical protein